MQRFFPIVVFIFLTACSNDQEKIEDLDFEESLNTLSEDILGPVWEVKSDNEFFEIEIPTQMKERDNLNPDAKLQYSFLEKTDSAVHEHFVIVVVEPYPDNDDSSDDIDVAGYTDAYIDSLMKGRAFEVLNEPTIEAINNTEATIHELSSFILGPDEQEIGIFYMLGVYKGSEGLYQVLTWTLTNQKDLFYGDMKHMLHSFKEIDSKLAEVHDEEDHAGHNH